MKYLQKSNTKRHKLIQDRAAEGLSEDLLIKDIEELKMRLQQAIFVEHFTIPPYLSALYSIKEGTNDTASRIIRSVVVEEMLHMIMVANILNAIGGEPSIKAESLIPKYPNPLPYSSGKFNVSLLKFSKEAINTFLRIEKPAKEDAPSQDGKYNSIGEFYAAIREALIRLEESAKPGSIFIGPEKNQVTSEHYYGSGGKLIAIYNLEEALKAIEEIVGQGEGIDGTINDVDDSWFEDDVEYAHYFRFNEIFHERYYQPGDKPNSSPSGERLLVDWNAVYNMEPNPKMDKYTDNFFLLEKMEAFNRTYTNLLDNIHLSCNGQPHILLEGIPLMFKLKHQAVELMKIPSGNGNYTLGPSFEYLV